MKVKRKVAEKEIGNKKGGERVQKKEGREENVNEQRLSKKRRKTQKIQNQEKNYTTADQCHPVHERQASVWKREMNEFWTDRNNEQMNH